MAMVQELTGQPILAMYVFLNNVSMESYLMLTLLGLLSLVVGSFISAVTYRLPRGLGFIKGRSFCDNCKKELFWYDNIPLFSFLIYSGAARCCNKPISIRYPLIEIASFVGTILLWILFQNMVYAVLFFLTLTIFVIDFEYQIIPDNLIWLILILLMFAVPSPLFTALFSGFFYATFLETLHLVTKGRGMGMGDVKLAIPLGLILGLEKGIYWLIASFILGGIFATVLLVLKRANLKTKIAFGPFLIIGFWLVFVISKLY